MIEANERKLCYIHCIIADARIGLSNDRGVSFFRRCGRRSVFVFCVNGAVRFYKISIRDSASEIKIVL